MARSRPNQLFFLALVLATFGMYFLDFALIGSAGIFTFVFATLAVGQGLRAFLRQTIFEESHLEHRTVFGKWRKANYSDVLISGDRGDSLTISGVDTTGKGITIHLRTWDGDLEKVSAFVQSAAIHPSEIAFEGV